MIEKKVRSQILNAFNFRYATKKFDKHKSISDEDWNLILEAGRLSPSSFGYEPWKIIEIDNKEIKNDLKKIAWGAVNSLEGADKFIVVLAHKNLTFNCAHVKHIVEDVLGLKYDENSPISLAFKHFQESDFELLDENSLFEWASKQTYILLANMITTAAFLKIDSCPIEGFNRREVEKYLSEHKIFNLNKFGVAYMAGFGYRDEIQPRKKRQKLPDIYTKIN